MNQRRGAGLSRAEIGVGFERHHGELFGFFVHRTGSHEASEDLIQDTFLRALTYRPSFDGRGSLRAWLYTIARNLLSDYAPERKRTSEPFPTNLVAEGPDPLDHAEQCSEIRRVQDALHSLRPDQNEVLLLARVQGLPYREVGAILGISEGAVKVRVFRALGALRDKMQQDENDAV